MWSMLIKGGPLMWPLLICSIISLAIIINRFVFYHKITHNEKILMSKIKSLVQENNIDKAVKVCDDFPGPVSSVIKAGLIKYKDGKEEMSNAMEEAGLYEIPHLEQYLSGLSTIASVSTLTGFTGTVTGMINAFNSIAIQGVSSPSIVARGISEALITTATGLIIAIPTLVFYHYFSYRLNRFTLEIERCSKELLNLR
ncbi:MAG: MotA/TolQ/ExbB proton channel family protein [Endomicrobiales bacterium]|nr:MotA/TolQ/ExbB proton channel family protein [Endomicrobiales bacterium]